MTDAFQNSTLKSLAQHLGLSITTISRALKNGPEVHPETVQRVKLAAKELGYSRNLSGVKLRTGETLTICAFLKPPLDNDVIEGTSVALMQGMQSVLSKSQYALSEMAFPTGEAAIAALRRIVDGRHADGVILDNTQPQDERVKFLAERRFPFVTFGRTELFTPHAYFDVDNEHAAQIATRWLIDRGHRRIALIDASASYLFVMQRERGYRVALRQSGLDFDPALMRQINISAQTCREIVLDLCRMAAPPTGFVSTSEVATLGVLAGLRDSGIEASGIDVASRDGTRLTSFLWPRPASCYFSLYDAGARLANLLLRRIGGAEPIELQEMEQAVLVLPTPS
jgi:LacI family transcriptional regulator